ncbi:peroxiredoxin-like family protein [Reichenbachiella ulvae]|uniref:thioredoxin-dependent peroxiredoxin n=1 Tax=Reichenbachiella ulvae TaxID=2980104 RepID=A0ABT3CXP5_9BACT|nr:peroxiredoxin-like family protein [Reichenbachiella ulvae]MCV9388412.1 AhpC/TSA family protein [Reichenbachiella ulvae]
MKKIVPFGLFILLNLCQYVLYAQADESTFSVGDQVPNFTGVDQFGNDFMLSEQLEKGPVVLMFYRGYWCPYCNKQLSEMQDSLKFISERGGAVVAVTPEQPEYIEETVNQTDASFKIIHDKDLQIMKSFGVAYKMEDALVKKYKRNGLDVAQTNGDNGTYLPVPATYIINSDGSILFAFYDPDYKKRATVSKILKNL